MAAVAHVVRAWICTVVLLSVVCVVKSDNVTDKLQAQVKNLEDAVKILTQQMVMQNFEREQMLRMDGDSGLQRTRHTNFGPESYYSDGFVGNNFLASHSHANFIDTIGMGEICVVMDGVQFCTRHNDYLLRQKHPNATVFGETMDIPFPPVPPEVLEKPTLEAQIEEMKKWFEAFAEQNYTVRDYRPYFKPVLCYIEGSWMHANQSTIEEPFKSDRHSLGADSYHVMMDKIMFNEYNGYKDEKENMAFLPTAILNATANGTVPELQQWNYRILCHPLEDDLPLNRLIPREYLAPRLAQDREFDRFDDSRVQSFDLAPIDSDTYENKFYERMLLDDMMYQIPGPEGYKGFIESSLLENVAYENKDVNKKMNAARYHRMYYYEKKDAQGRFHRNTAFSDNYLFVAQTTHKKIPSMSYQRCERKRLNCRDTWDVRISVALPVEIIYLLPTHKWNPYKIPYKGSYDSADGMYVFMNDKGTKGRAGSKGLTNAYNGSNSAAYYRTPYEMFGNEVGKSSADTSKDCRYVLNPKNSSEALKLRASGIRMNVPLGDKSIRTRYPIMPLHVMGNPTWKEVDALKKLVLEPTNYRKFYHDEVPITEPR